VITLTGIEWALVCNTVSFFGVLVAVSLIVIPTRAADGLAVKPGIWSSIRAGARFARREPGLWVMYRTMCVVTLLAAPFIALIPPMAVKVLDGKEGVTAALVTAQGIGAVIAALSMGQWVERFGSRRVLVTAMCALVVALLLYASMPNTALVAVALVAVGASYLGCLMSFTTIAQRRSPTEMRGRVMSLNMMILGSLYPLGALVQGKLADAVGLRQVTAASAIALAAVMLLTRALRPGFTDPIDGPLDAVVAPTNDAPTNVASATNAQGTKPEVINT
jgi:predicted MFS family arabinose efflux permease